LGQIFIIVLISILTFMKMKASGALVPLLATSAWGAAVYKRQSNLLGALGTIAIKPDNVAESESKLRAGAKHSIARFGPFTLPAVDVSCADYRISLFGEQRRESLTVFTADGHRVWSQSFGWSDALWQANGSERLSSV
jgi:hypothetical protein